MSVLAFARTDVPTVGSDETVRAASREMAAAGVDSVVIVDDRRVVGVVEDRDVVRLVRAGGDPAVTAATALGRSPETVSADAGVFEAVRRLDETGARCLPVAADGELQGVVTPSDLVVILSEQIGEAAGSVEFDPTEPLASELSSQVDGDETDGDGG